MSDSNFDCRSSSEQSLSNHHQSLGKRIVKASLANGNPTFVFHRHEIGVDIEKVQMLLSFKEQGARLVEGSFDDHLSMVNAVKQVDVVICAISGVHIRSHHILLQLKLVDAIKEASEFGTDPSRMDRAIEPGRVTFDDKMVVRRAIEDANIPFTYISANCFAGYFVGGLCQPGKIIPSRDSVCWLHVKFSDILKIYHISFSVAFLSFMQG